jgi:hypothetical protein
MKKIYIYIILLLFANVTLAQEQDIVNDELPETIKASVAIDALKTAFITKELELTPDEAQKFWPVYNEYIVEIKKAKLEFKDDIIAFEERKVIVLKKYRENFKRILGNEERVKKCFNAAPRFHQLLKKEWIRRQGLKRPRGMQPRLHPKGRGAGPKKD